MPKALDSIQEGPIRALTEKRSELMEEVLGSRDSGFLQACSQVMDEYFRDAFALSKVGPRMRLDKNPYAVVALGGYGRREMCVGSDVDILLLFARKIPSEATELVQEIVYPLWDAGLEVGYSTRTLKDCTRLGEKDFEVLTSMVDARFVCGASNLYTDLREALTEKVLRRQGKKYLKWLTETSLGRHERFGDATSLLEPNIKDGQGGLRDYHVMLWVGRALLGLREPRDLEYAGHLSHSEYADLERSLSFIWAVRNHLHALSGRKNDQLYFEYQREVAKSLHFTKKDSLEGVERFLGELHGHMECVKLLHQAVLHIAAQALGGQGRKKSHRTGTPGVLIEKDSLEFESPRKIVQTPRILAQIFEESARLKLPLSVEARRLVKEFAYLVNDDFRKDPKVTASFEFVLKSHAPGSDVLEEMLNAGFLTAMIPEFSDIVHRIQYTEYHVYPVDQHSLKTVEVLKDLGRGKAPTDGELAASIYRKVSPKRVLFMAGLLHDVGKGPMVPDHAEVGAGMARAAVERLGWSKKNADTVEFLVRHHLLLMKTATRRDLNDEQTALFVARKVGTVMRLKMLYLLTVADSVATGEKAYNTWSVNLLKELFFKALHIMERGDLASRRAVAEAERKREKLLEVSANIIPAKRVEEVYGILSPRYLSDADPQDMLRHIRLLDRMEGRDAVLEVVPGREPGLRTVNVCAKDRPGLFFKVAGVFALNNVNIMDAQIYTWRNHVALDVFHVEPPPDNLFEKEVWKRTETDLQKALAGELPLDEQLDKKLGSGTKPLTRAALRRERVRVDNETSNFFTIIEVIANDRIGLLYQITRALYESRLDVWVAKIATKADQVVDVFYVRDFDGQKVDFPEQVEAVTSRLEETLAGTSPVKKESVILSRSINRKP